MAALRTTRAIGTHSGTFHCDEALACYLLRLTAEFNGATITRSRDAAVLDKLDILVDVGGQYDPSRHRYDHHQRGFQETFSPKHAIKLSSAGLVYKHFGRSIVRELTGVHDEKLLDAVYQRTYTDFVAALDAIDNGVPQYPAELVPAYKVSTDLGSRVGRLNPSWNETVDDAELDTRFSKAMLLAGIEFEASVKGCASSWLPARKTVAEALSKRFEIDATGQTIVLETFVPWKEHLVDFAEEEGKEQDPRRGIANIKYVVYPNSPAEGWRVLCVPIHPSSFVCKQPLPEPWRGLRDDALDAVSGVPGGVFVHHGGFTGGHKTREGIMAMVQRSIAHAGAANDRVAK